jgi:hypothetical protein
MRWSRTSAATAFLLCLGTLLSTAQQPSLSDLAKGRTKSSTAVVTTHDGSPALKLIPKHSPDAGYVPGGPILFLNDTRFHNGAIDIDVSGTPAPGAPADARGFIGFVFHVQSDTRYEIVYIRPTNSHADDQLRKNHTTQYASEPDWPWERLRKETPGVYESWADLEPGKWTHMKIVVHGTDASLYINHAQNPCLIVHDLKLGDIEGTIGLWMGEDTEGYFKNLSITKE